MNQRRWRIIAWVVSTIALLGILFWAYRKYVLLHPDPTLSWIRNGTTYELLNPKMLGVKVFSGQTVSGGEIIVRQRGTQFWPGDGTGLGRDHTIFATRAGKVEFKPGRRGRMISVEPA